MYNQSPYKTLAAEELLLRNISKNETVLFLYTHPKAVIIGRNQNARTECRVSELEADGGELARRISGGGAVYHDLGNLNFSFIVNRENYDLKRQQNVLCDAVNSLGINAEVSGRNDILAAGKKFSGNAFCFKKENAFHHGTILIDTDISNLTKYLQVDPQKIHSKGINSVRSRVINLTEINPGITVKQTAEALKSAFSDEYGNFTQYELSETDKGELLKIRERNSSREWIFGENPKFDITFECKFEWGLTQIYFITEKDCIKNCAIYSDSLDADLILKINDSLHNISYTKEAIISALAGSSDKDNKIAKDLIKFFAEQNI